MIFLTFNTDFRLNYDIVYEMVHLNVSKISLIFDLIWRDIGIYVSNLIIYFILIYVDTWYSK